MPLMLLSAVPAFFDSHAWGSMRSTDYDLSRAHDAREFRRWIMFGSVQSVWLRAVGRFGLGVGLALLIYEVVRLYSVRIAPVP